MDNLDAIKIVLLAGTFLLLIIVFLKQMVIDKRLSNLENREELDPHERVLAQELARLEYEDRKIELAKKKAEEEARLKAEAERKAKEQEEINKLEEEARSLGNY